MTIRDYQGNDIKTINSLFLKHDGVLYQLPTGGGKSVVATELVDGWIKKTRVLVLAHRKELIDQMKGHFENKKMVVGKMIGKVETNMDAKVVVASVNTATRDNRLETLLEEEFGYIVVDEAHRIASNSYENVIKKIREKNPNCKLLGLSATPHRKDKKSLGEYFTEIVVSIDIKGLIKKGFLADFNTFATPVKNLEEEVEKSGSDYQVVALSTYMKHQTRIDYAVESYKLHGEEQQVLVFCVDRSHAKKVHEAYAKAGYKNFAYIDGETPELERDEILENFRKGKLQGIISIETLTEGTDLPETGCVQLLRPTLSLTLYMQMTGRGLRPKKDGRKLIILDNAGCSQEFGLISSPKKWSLNPHQDPCEPSEGNRVVAKRKDGTYTEDLDDAEFMELEEWSHEEWLEKMVNDAESAEKYNEELKQRVIDLKVKLGEDFIEEVGLKNYIVKAGSIYSASSDIYIHSKSNADFQIELDIQSVGRNNSESTKIMIPRIGGHMGYDYKDSLYKLMMENYMAAGQIAEKLIKDKSILKWYVEETKRIEKIEEGKVDTHKLQQNAKEIKRKIMMDNVTEHLKTRKTIYFAKPFSADNYFQMGWGRWNKIVKIVFANDKLMYSNAIELIAEDGQVIYSSKSTKQEKLTDIFEGQEPILDEKSILAIEKVQAEKEAEKEKLQAQKNTKIRL